MPSVYESQKVVLQIGKRFFVRFSPTTGNIQTAAYIGGARLFGGLYDADMPVIVRALQSRGVNPVLVRLRLTLDCGFSSTASASHDSESLASSECLPGESSDSESLASSECLPGESSDSESLASLFAGATSYTAAVLEGIDLFFPGVSQIGALNI